jgi:hypothetical protein
MLSTKYGCIIVLSTVAMALSFRSIRFRNLMPSLTVVRCAPAIASAAAQLQQFAGCSRGAPAECRRRWPLVVQLRPLLRAGSMAEVAPPGSPEECEHRERVQAVLSTDEGQHNELAAVDVDDELVEEPFHLSRDHRRRWRGKTEMRPGFIFCPRRTASSRRSTCASAPASACPPPPPALAGGAGVHKKRQA